MKIKIMGVDYTLKFEKEFAKDAEKYGLYSGGRMLIKIDSEAKKERQEATIVHEILEAIDYELELKLDHATISRLEFGIYSTFKQNGLINFSKLFKEEK